MAWTKDQEKAIYETGTNIIVSAGAGSGKTAVLSERILKKIEQGISIDSLLVLTFTEAAAFEMKTRIKKKILENPKTSSKASEIDSAYITTFDSYALSIVKKYHYLLNIDKNISVIDKSILKLYKIQTLNNIFEEYYKEKNPDFLNFIASLCHKNDNFIKNELLEIDNKLDLKLNKEDYLNTYEEQYLNSTFINKIYQDFENLILEKVEQSQEYYDLFFDELSESNQEKVNAYYSDYFNATSIDDLYILFHNKAPSISLKDEEAKQNKEVFKKIVDDIKKKIYEYPSKNDFINSYLYSFNYFKIVINILKELNNRVNKYKKDNLLFDFSDIAKMSINCLKENPDELNKLKNSLNEILLDEYQDTNDLQEEFISLISNHNVYMVGDIKQSIYRFRNANPSIFMNKYETYKINGNNNGIKIDLMKNFRSRGEVIDAINLIFAPIMNLTRGGADYKKDHIMHFGNTKYIEKGKVDNQSFTFECPCYNYDEKESKYSNKEIEIFYMANDIINKINNNYLIMDKDKEIVRPVTYKDFAILIDKSNNFNLITKIFNYFNIPTEIIKNDDLTSNSLIHTFSNILNLIKLNIEQNYNDEFKLSFMSVARSFIINMHDDELARIILTNNIFNTNIYSLINNLSSNIEIKSNSMLVEEIINEFDIINKLELIGDIEQNLMRLEYIVNLAINYSNLNLNGLSFISKIKDILDNEFNIEIDKFSTNVDSVKIMTIHKSKGLEYPVVYLPFLTSEFFNSENTSKFIYSSNYQFIIPLKDEEKSLTKYLHLSLEKKETLSEKIRLFYVALTRAREKLIMIRQNPTNENNLQEYNLNHINSLNDLLNSIGGTLDSYSFSINIDALNISNEYIIFNKKKITLSKENISITYKENIDNSKEIERVHSSKETKELIDYETSKKMNAGTKMHEIMESIDLVNPDFSSVEPWMIKHIKYFLNLDILKNLDKAKIYKEYEFSFETDKIYHGIIDLLIEYDDKVLIIDYKLSDIDNEEYIKQLGSYKEYIKSLNLNKEIHMYLFSFLENKIKEI